jgi:epsilon-lactone hydrolase
MPSQQNIRFMQQHPMGGGMPGMKDLPGPGARTPSGKIIIPTLPEGFKPEIPAVPRGFTCQEVTVNGVKGLRVSTAKVKKGLAFMHIHGGGFTFGSAVGGVPLLVHLAETLQMEGYSIEYHLAPRYKFPVPIDECVAFYQGLLDQGFQKIVIGGESAGGTLSIAVTLCLKDRHCRLPVAVVALSPIGNIAFHRNKLYKRDMFTESGPLIIKAYAAKADLKNPYLSPVYGDFKGYPPLLIQAGGDESLAGEAVHLAEAAARNDNEVVLHIWKEMGHAFALQFGSYPEADAAMQEITCFIHDKLELESLAV